MNLDRARLADRARLNLPVISKYTHRSSSHSGETGDDGLGKPGSQREKGTAIDDPINHSM